VDFPIYFYYQSCFLTVKIYDELADAMLTPKDKIKQLAIFQVFPKLFFCWCWFVPFFVGNGF
jgi:hypothetical protein